MDCWALDESRDGQLIATGSHDGYLRFWDAATGRESREAIEHPDGLLTVNFSPDGRLAGTGCHDFRIRVWEVASGKLAYSMSPTDYPTDVQFTPDGRFAIIALGSGMSVWSLQDSRPISPIVSTNNVGGGTSLDISADGQWALIAGRASQASVVDLQQLTSPAPGSPEKLLLWIELVANARVDGSSIVDLTPTEWLERWRRYRQNHLDFRPFENQ
jgi:WD40 repeat protein